MADRVRSLTLPEPADFWRRVEIRGADECWPWIGGCRKDGYGEYGGRKSYRHARAHRLAWQFTNGPISAELFVCHSCDNPPCCNPAHLFLGTHEDNQNDKVAKGRARNANCHKTQCKRGHSLSGDNLFINSHGERQCRTCDRARQRRAYERDAENQRSRCRRFHHAVRKVRSR